MKSRAMFIPVAALLVCSAASPVLAQLAPAPQRKAPTRAEKRAASLATDSVNAELAGDHKRAFDLAAKVIAADPADAWGYYLRGDALVAMGRTQDAVTSFAASEGHFSPADPWGKSVAIWGEGNAYSEATHCDKASPEYQRYAAFVEHLDAAAAAAGRQQAMKDCAPPPPSRMSQSEIASANAETSGDFTDALQWADAAIRENPDDGLGYRMRGDALLSLQRYDEAVAAYRQAEQRLTSREPHEASLAIWGQANALHEAGRCKDAAPIYERYATSFASADPTGASMARNFVRMCPLKR